jgi:acetyltransferase-like isoleucine patch superfamily enzyme
VNSKGPARSPLHGLLGATLKRVGKDYEPASDLPASLILNVLRVRAAWLLRGLIRFRARVFVASDVRVRGKGQLNLGRGSTLERGVVLDGYARHGVTIGERTRIGAYAIVSCTSHLSLYGKGFSIGSDSGIGEFSFIGAAGGVKVGNNVIMGQFIGIHSQEHEFSDPDTPIRLQPSRQTGIIIDDDCWIGARVTFLDGSHVQRGSVVAAGSVVKGEFPPRSVIAGVPARVIGNRSGDPTT